MIATSHPWRVSRVASPSCASTMRWTKSGAWWRSGRWGSRIVTACSSVERRSTCHEDRGAEAGDGPSCRLRAAGAQGGDRGHAPRQAGGDRDGRAAARTASREASPPTRCAATSGSSPSARPRGSRSREVRPIPPAGALSEFGSDLPTNAPISRPGRPEFLKHLAGTFAEPRRALVTRARSGRGWSPSPRASCARGVPSARRAACGRPRRPRG